jgi:hypothetical protein
MKRKREFAIFDLEFGKMFERTETERQNEVAKACLNYEIYGIYDDVSKVLSRSMMNSWILQEEKAKYM